MYRILANLIDFKATKLLNCFEVLLLLILFNSMTCVLSTVDIRWIIYGIWWQYASLGYFQDFGWRSTKGYWMFWIKFHSIYLIHTLRRTQKEKVIKMKDAYIPISFNKLWIAGRGLFKCEFISSSSLFFLYYDDVSLGLILDAEQIRITKQN